MQQATMIIFFALAAPAAASWGAPDTTPAPKSLLSGFDISWPPKTALKGVLKTNGFPQLPTFGSLGCKWDTVAGGVKCSYDHTYSKKVSDTVTLEKNFGSKEEKFGSVCCKLSGDPMNPMGATGSISGSAENEGLPTLCYDLKHPIDGSGYLAGTIGLKKKLGDAMCSVESPPMWPPKPKANITGTLDNGLCCTLVLKQGHVAKGHVEKTFETDFGSVCCGLETDLNASPDPTGTLTVKKKMGKVCANLEANTHGSVKCTFDTNWAGTRTLAETSANFISISVVALIGLVAGSGLTVTMLRVLRREGPNAGEEPLLIA
jgi:hypothetical protein